MKKSRKNFLINNNIYKKILMNNIDAIKKIREELSKVRKDNLKLINEKKEIQKKYEELKQKFDELVDAIDFIENIYEDSDI